MTLGDYADAWIASLTKRPRTLETYRYHLNAQLRPRFGNRKLAEISTDDCAPLVADLTRQGLAAYTVRGALRVLSGMRMGHKNANVTLAVYAHEFEKQRTADDTRTKLADGFGHLLSARS